MDNIYNISTRLVKNILPVSTLFSEKMRKFVEGRKETFKILNAKIKKEDKVVWFHMASLGEFEQGLPIINIVKKLLPAHKILVSFFSPSGYENKKNTPVADAVVYLPIDTSENAAAFLDAAHPDLAVFIKYEFWPNHLRELKEREIPAILVSGGFRKDQLFFKSYGNWMKKSLKTFDHFFVQNTESRELLNGIGFYNVTLSGDTRFDRVAAQLEQDNRIDFIEEFIDGKTCIVAGSTWQEDEDLLNDYIDTSPDDIKIILAPHEISADRMKKLKDRFKKKVTLFSEKAGADLKTTQVFIVDTIGLLSRIYSYADIAYVGGAAGKTGLHNILEPATFGIPIIIGSNYEKFPEAKQLQRLAGLYSVSTAKELKDLLTRFINDPQYRKQTGMIAGHFVNSNTGATRIVEEYLQKHLKEFS